MTSKYTHPTFRDIFDEIMYDWDRPYNLVIHKVRQSDKTYTEYAYVNKLYIYPDGKMQYKMQSFTYPKHLWTKVKKLAILLEETDAEKVLYGNKDSNWGRIVSYSKQDLKLFEDTRQGRNICKKCSKPKEMYYSPWCPRCDIPKPKKKEVLNLIQVLRHLEEVNDAKSLKDKIWSWLLDMQYIRSNDSYFSYFIDEDYDEFDEIEQELLVPHLKLLNQFVKDYTGKESVIFEVSW